MIRNTIVRTLKTSTITSYRIVIKEGKPIIEELPVLVVAGNVSEKHALKELYKVHGKDNSIKISNIELQQNTFEISVNDFMKYSKKVDITENK